MDNRDYFQKLYPLQDKVLEQITSLKTGFYLTGGTASSRGYLNHRLSEDLDFFVNDDNRFLLWSERIIQTLNLDWKLSVMTREERFVRLFVQDPDIPLKIELVNDVPSHIGIVREHPVLGLLDSPENILANKVSAAIDRNEPKDLADIWGFCLKLGLSLETALQDACSKAAGIFPADLARILCSAAMADWEAVRWIDAPPPEQYLEYLNQLGERLLLP